MGKNMQKQEVSSKEKIESVINRIDNQRKELRQALEDINEKIQYVNKKDNKESLGFDINNIQRNIENEELKTLIAKRNAIKRVLEKDNYYDTEFCNVAKEYIEEIREDIKENDEKIQKNLEDLEQAKLHLEELTEKIQRENYDISIRTSDLLENLGGSTYTLSGHNLSGTYVLSKIERKLNNILDN